MAKILIAGLGKGMIDRNSEERDYRKADYKIKIEETGEYKVYVRKMDFPLKVKNMKNIEMN